MKKLFDQIDDLCARASSPQAVCLSLKLTHATFRRGNGVGVHLSGTEHLLPDATNLRWRRVWRAFLTDHVDDVANSLAAVPAAVPGGQPAATA